MITVKHFMLISLSALAVACAPKEPVKYLALSFDDGPNLTTESKMLDVLAKHDVLESWESVGGGPSGVPVLGRSEAGMGLEELEEDGLVGEMELIDDFLDGQVGVFQ